MNLFGNALKYTARGFVHVKLEAVPLPNMKQKSSRINLTVSDSGKGMSKDYLDTRLFTPFAQEDPLLPGTGLGLSIVKQVVSKMGGDISVESEPGKGTKICVSVVMNHAPILTSTCRPSEISLALARCNRMKAIFLDTEEKLDPSLSPPPSGEVSKSAMETHHLCLSTIARTLKDWFGVDLHVTSKADDIHDADLVLVTDYAHERLLHTTREESPNDRVSAVPTLVLCKSFASARVFLTSSAPSQRRNHVHFPSQPFGPRKLARTLLECFQNEPRAGALCSPTSASENTGGAIAAMSERRIKDVKVNITHLHPQSTSSWNSDTLKQDPAPTSTHLLERNVTIPDPAQGENSNGRQDSTAVVTKRGLHFLIVDDNKINLQLLVRYARSHNHSFVTAMDGVEAVEAYQTATKLDCKTTPATNASFGHAQNEQNSSIAESLAFDFVLMDISMPRMDGLEASRRIRAFELANGLQNTTIIALTGLASVSAQQEAFSSGVNLFLTKPVNLKELGRLLDDWKSQKSKC